MANSRQTQEDKSVPNDSPDSANAGTNGTKDQTAEDVFAQAERVRSERTKSGERPSITRKPSPIPVLTKTKAWFRVHPNGVFRVSRFS